MNIPDTFDHLNELPPEVCGMIFEYMVQNTVDQQLRKRRDWESSTNLYISEVVSHLMSSPWVTLNKQYCPVYLGAFLRQVELEALIEFSRRPSRFYSGPSNTAQLEKCLKFIKHQFKLVGSQSAFRRLATETPFEGIKAICLVASFALAIFGRALGKNKDRRHPHFPNKSHFVRPMKQLRRFHERYHVPADKLSLVVCYGDPTQKIMDFVEEGRQEYWFDDDLTSHPLQGLLLRPVRARIHLHDYNASIAAIDRELEVLKEAVDRTSKVLRDRYSDSGHLTDLETLVTSIEKDIIVLRRAHMEIVDHVTSYWKGQDGWYELDDMFRIAKAWAMDSETDRMPEHPTTSTATDQIDLE